MKLAELYRQMVRIRELETAVSDLWSRGLISGEMHAGLGEEGIAAGVSAHLEERDALALTHRCTGFVLLRGVPMDAFIKELLGRDDGLCRGRGGHMHLFSKPHRLATSGIVGASLPTAAGFALSAKRQRPGAIAMAQTGEGAMNAGMVLETLNLAVAWALPMVVVCIANGWAITVPDGSLTGGALPDRAEAFGWRVATVDGTDVMAVYETAGSLIDFVRRKKEPALLYATSPRISGHFLGDPLMRVAREPLGDGKDMMKRTLDGAMAGGAGSILARAAGLTHMMGALGKARAIPQPGSRKDPLVMTRRRLEKQGDDVDRIDAEARAEIAAAIDAALEGHHG